MCHPFRIQDDDDGAILHTISEREYRIKLLLELGGACGFLQPKRGRGHL